MPKLVRLTSLAIVFLLAPGILTAQSFRTNAPPPHGLIGFGVSAAISGEEVLVGRPGLIIGFPMPPSQTGAIHVFRRSGRAWTETGAVSARDTVLGDGFGSALAADGNMMVVGAPNGGEGKGAVYVFERDREGTWSERAKLTARDAVAGDRLGAAVAIGNGIVLAGAPGRGQGAGIVIAFRRDASGTWSEQGRLTGSGIAAGDAFGSALSLGGDAVVVGAPGPTGGALFGPQAQSKPGAAFLFRRASSGTWSEEGRLALAQDTTIRALGMAVLLDGNQVFVSSPVADGGAGAVLHFRREGTEWRNVGRITAGSPMRPALFGLSLARDGTDLLVGAPMAAQQVGMVHVLRLDSASGSWRDVQQLTTQGVGLGTQFGAAIAVRNGVAVLGAPSADFFEGKGFVYSRASANGQWREASVIVDNTGTGLTAIRGGEVKCDSGQTRMFDCRDVDLVSFLPVSALGGKRGIMLNDMWGWTDSETGREFAIVGRLDGTAFVEVTDPANPVYVGELPLHRGAQPNLWRDMKVYKNHVFIVSDGAGPHGVQVFDLTQLRSVRNPPVTFEETAHYDRIHSAHNIAIDEESGFAFTIGNSMGGETCGGGPHMIDIREPTRPTFAGCWADTTTGNARTGYTHDSQCVVYRGPDQRYAGKQLCFNASETAVGIADVTDKKNPKRISSVSYPNVAYAHQGWLSDDQRYFFLNDEGDELSGTAPRTRTVVFDVSDLEDPVVLKEFLGTTPATDHNLYVKGRYMYQSNYVAGLRVIDVSDPANPVEVGYLDTVPFGQDIPGFAGTWSNYPFFKSGVVGVTSMREGLFLVRYRAPAMVP
jgi:choice-of-anchor B domain-containing protein